MSARLLQMDPAEPLRPWRGRPEAARGPLTCVPFEYSSRGDRVPATLLLPARTPAPLVLLVSDAPDAATHAADWAAAGLAVARVDPPLLGSRASAKLAERVLDIPRRGAAGAFDRSLWSSFARQLVSDGGRALDVLLEQPEIDPARVAFVGFGRGAQCGAALCAEDRRLGAVALVGLRDRGQAEAAALDRIPPRPLLLLDESAPQGAGGEPGVPGEESDRLRRFLGEALGGPGV